MKYSQKKRRLLTGIASLSFFIVASLCFGMALEGQQRESILGFHINEDAQSLLDYIPFFNAKAETNQPYPYGNVKNQVILVNVKETDDASIWLNDAKIAQANDLLNANADSLQQYISNISANEVNVESEIYGYQDGAVSDGYTLDQPLSYYIESKELEPQREEELLREVIQKFDENHSLADSLKETLDTNQDGYIDNMTFVIRGNKQDDHNLFWPHQYSLNVGKDSSQFPIVHCQNGELKVRDYNIIISGDGGVDQPGNPVGIFSDVSDLGVIAHEYLHIYGFPDMYHNYKYDPEASGDSSGFVQLDSSEQKGDPLGSWDIMDNTVSYLPQNPLYYTNMAYSPWKEQIKQPETITDSKQSITLKQLNYASKENAMAAILKVDKNLNAKAEDEYFMVEYRKKEGWDAGLQSSGLIVYRINMAANYKNPETAIQSFCKKSQEGKQTYCGNMFGPPDEVYIFRPGVTSLDTSTLAPGGDNNLKDAALSQSSAWGASIGLPLDSTDRTLDKTIYFSDGSNSGIVISNVSDTSGNTITFDVEMPKSTEDKIAPVIDEKVDGNGIEGRWINGTPALSVYVSDEGNGLDSIEVTTSDGELMDGDTKTSYTKTYPASQQIKQTNFSFRVAKNGTYQVKAIDQSGNASIVKTIKVENLDHVLPTIEMGKVTRTTTETVAPVTFYDQESGIAEDTAFYTTIEIKGDTTSLTYPHQIVDHKIHLDADFQGKICVIVKDIAGNASKEPSCWVLSNDKTAPAISATADNQDTGWTGNDRTITVMAKDEGEDATGISYMEITTENGHINANNARQLVKDYGSAGTTSETYSFDVTSNGTYEIKVCDYASNCETSEVAISNIDQSIPVVTDIIIKNDTALGLFMKTSHSVQFVAHDEPTSANSGLKEIYYQLVEEGAAYEDDPTATVWKKANIDETITTAEGFVGTIYAYAMDEVGNRSKVFQKKIERITTETDGSEMEEGISDSSKTVSIIGLHDPEVSIAMKDANKADIETTLNEDFMASHDLQSVYQFSLLKRGNPYSLEQEVTVRLAVDDALLKNGSLRLVSINEQGETTNVESTIGDGYLEFKTDSLAGMYATVTEKVTEPTTQDSTPVVKESSPQTGDAHALGFYIIAILSSIAGMSLLLWYHRKDHWME